MSFLVGIGTTRLSRPRHRLLLAICLLWTLECCVLSCASAAIFDASAVSVVARVTPQFNTEAGQRLECDRVGGSLFTDVSTAVHAKLRAHMINHVGVSTYIGYLGGSSAQSPACPTTGPSLKCIWRWDSGRYGAVETVFLFYKGNAPPQKLLGVGPLNNLPSFWYSANSTQQYPESHHQQHLVMMQTAGRSAAWKDSSPAKFSYSTLNTGTWYALCMLTSAATKTRMAPTSQTRRSSPLQSRESVSSAGGAAPDGFLSLATYDGTDTQPKNSSTPLSAGAWAGIGVVIGVVATAFVVGVVCVLGKYHGWCCFGISTRADAAAADASSSSSDSRRNAGEDIRPSFASRSASTSAATSRSVSDRVVAKTPAGAPGGSGSADSTDSLASLQTAFAQFAVPAVEEMHDVARALAGGGHPAPRPMQLEPPHPSSFSSPASVPAVVTSPASKGTRIANPYVYTPTPSLPPEPVPQAGLTRTRRMSTIRTPHRPQHRRSPSVSFVDLSE